MAITAFTSTAIIDATTIGTTVLTASSEGIAADAIGLGSTNDVTFNSVNCVDGSFSGNLTNEVGGSYKLYNLGTENDADSEYLDISSDTAYRIYAKQTGTGAIKEVTIGNTDQRWRMTSTSIIGTVGTVTKFSLSASDTVFSTPRVKPASDNSVNLGINGARWSNVNSVNGDFSGTMTLSNLPTADPAAAGQLWNDSGTVKISSG